MVKLLTVKDPSTLTSFKDYAVVVAVGGVEEISADYYDFPWRTACERYFINKYPVQDVSKFISFINPTSLPEELKEHQEYLLGILTRHHHAFTLEEQLELAEKPWTEVAAVLRKRLNQNCDKIFRDWLEECTRLDDKITSGNVCYYQKPGEQKFFASYLELFLNVKYAPADEKEFFIVLTDDDVTKFRANPEILNWPVNSNKLKSAALAKFSEFLTAHDYLY